MDTRPLEKRVARYISEYAGQGDHTTGSSADLANAQWMTSIIAELGVTPLIHEYVFSRLNVHRAELLLGNAVIRGVPLFDGGSTSVDGVSGSLGLLGSTADIGIVMVPPYSADQQVQELDRVRHSNKHLAIIAVTDAAFPADGVATLNAEDFIRPGGCPVLQVANTHWPVLNDSAQRSRQARLLINTSRNESKMINVGARVTGTNTLNDPIVVMTPRSGWWRCASERGGGIAAYFEIMRAAVSGNLSRDIIFTANSGHELGHLGLDLFLEDQPDLVKQANTWIHLGANFAASGSGANVLLQYSDEERRQVTRDVMKQLPSKPYREMPIEMRPLGEARNIFDGGGRFVSILGSNPAFHHPSDQWPDAVDLQKACGWIEVFTHLVAQLGSYRG